jgi:hypothetical protein
MKTWKSKIFGDNYLNFYGWILAGLSVVGASFYFVLKAVLAGGIRSPQSQLLLAIYFLLLGHFGIAVHNYLARAARSIESAEENDGEARE